MNGYKYIVSFFKSILEQSKTIQGRLVILPNKGNELNADDFGQVIIEHTKGQKFPVCAMLPPKSSGVFGKNDEWEDYIFDLFFLNTTFYNTAGQISSRNPVTNTSSRPVIEEWEDMKVAATDFMRVLQLVQSGKNSQSVNLLNNVFRLHNNKKYIEPISFTGSHRLSGVHMRFEASVFTTCGIQDYVDGGLVVLPTSDESTFEPELIVVRTEVLRILSEMDISPEVIDGGIIM